MWARYGNYTHGQRQLVVTQSRENLYTPRGEKWGIGFSISIRGAIGTLTATQADLVSEADELYNAYGVDGLDFSYRFPDLTSAPVLLNNANTFDGVRVVRPPSFDNPDRTQWTSYAYYSIELQATIDLIKFGLTSPNPILEFHEDIDPGPNGGPIFTLMPQEFGTWLPVQTYPASPVPATQSGTIVALNGYVIPTPSPRWPQWLQQDQSTNPLNPQMRSPRVRILNGGLARLTEFTTSYSYRFLSPTPLTGGTPTVL